MNKLRLLDLGCKQGGASVGLARAGFDVTGLDIEPQPRFPLRFILGNMLTCSLEDYDAYWCSPPCEAYSRAALQWRKAGRVYPDLIALMRERLRLTGKPYIIENVPGAPLVSPVTLNGAMFQLRLRRRRLFECSFSLPLVLIPKEERSTFRMGRPAKEGDMVVPVGHFSNVPYVRKLMDCEWMNQEGLAHAIPPAYSEFLGKYLMEALKPE